MDLVLNRSDLNKEKKIKLKKETNQTILCQNNNNNNNNKVLAEEFQKSYDFDFESVGHKKTEESICYSFENNIKNKDVFEKSNSNKLLNEFLEFCTKNLKLGVDLIHERYVSYCNQTQSQRDSTKTDFTYSKSFSYNPRIDPSKVFEWSVPNMSRKSIITSVESSTQSTRTSSTISKVEMSNSFSNTTIHTNSDIQSSQLSDPRTNSGALMFTRSQCLGGTLCEAGCDVHKAVRRRHIKTEGIVIPNSGEGLEPEMEFSEDEDYVRNNRLNFQRLNNYRQNGFRVIDGTEEDEEEDEEITVVRKVTNIFRTTVNNTSKFIDSVTPNRVKSVTNKCPKLWLLLLLLSILGPLLYLMSPLISSPLLSQNESLDRLISDISSNNAINELVKELKDIKYDLNSLKQSNNELKHQIKTNEFDGNENNEKFIELNNKIKIIEELFNNISKNCCQNQTDSMLALIDLRLSAFMSSMLSQNQNTRQSMSASEAAQELKIFIQNQLRQTNDVFRESVEQKLLSTIDKVEQEMRQKPNDLLSNNITIDEIKSLIGQALAIYDADKTGQPDFALEPAGGTVINTRCSETYDPYGVQYKVFGMPVWSSSVSPRAVIQPQISPGECWAFKGSTGYLVIKLSQPITPTAFSYEHIPKQISRDGNIDSAPKELQVRGLDEETDNSGHLLGNYVYEDNNQPMQYFVVQDPNPRPVQFIELVILSNHGHNDYTCLYRFRVHGKRVNH